MRFFCTAYDAGTHFLLRTCVDRLTGDGTHTIASEMTQEHCTTVRPHRIAYRCSRYWMRSLISAGTERVRRRHAACSRGFVLRAWCGAGSMGARKVNSGEGFFADFIRE